MFCPRRRAPLSWSTELTEVIRLYLISLIVDSATMRPKTILPHKAFPPYRLSPCPHLQQHTDEQSGILTIKNPHPFICINPAQSTSDTEDHLNAIHIHSSDKQSYKTFASEISIISKSSTRFPTQSNLITATMSALRNSYLIKSFENSRRHHPNGTNQIHLRVAFRP